MSYGVKAADRLAGKTVLLTGASSGIGQATAVELAGAAHGNIKLIITARRLERLNELKSTLVSKYQNISVLPLAFDISKYRDVRKWVEKLPSGWSKVDVLINNAGLASGKEKVGEILEQDIEAMYFTNVLGMIELTNAFVSKFRAQGAGDVVMLGSIAGREAYPGGSIYCATKASLRSFTSALRRETIDVPGIRVIEVDPGAVETEFSLVRFRGDKSQADAVYTGTDPLSAEDIAEIIVFALSRRQNTVIAETLVFPSHQAGAGAIHRK